MDNYKYKIEDNSGLTANFTSDWIDKTRIIIDAQSVTFRVGTNGGAAVNILTVDRLTQKLQNVESITLNGVTYMKSDNFNKPNKPNKPDKSTIFASCVTAYSSTTPAILSKGHYKNHDFVIIYIGSHPCAYVQCEKDLYNADVDCPAHGGLSFFDNLLYWDLIFPGNHDLFKQTFIGWDYSYYGDYDNHYESHPEEIRGRKLHKWKTSEICQNVYEVIDWMEEYDY